MRRARWAGRSIPSGPLGVLEPGEGTTRASVADGQSCLGRQLVHVLEIRANRDSRLHQELGMIGIPSDRQPQ